MASVVEPSISERPVFLLGAGASMDADLPGAYQLTEDINAVAEQDQGRYEVEAKVFRFLVGAILATDSTLGASPFAKVDIERVMRGLDLLRDRRVSEANAFVALWHPSISQFDKHVTDTQLSSTKFLKSLQNDMLGH